MRSGISGYLFYSRVFSGISGISGIFGYFGYLWVSMGIYRYIIYHLFILPLAKVEQGKPR